MNNTGIKTGGRAKGKKNLKTVDLRETINSFVAHNFEAAQATYYLLPPKEQLNFLTQLLKYSLPALSSVQNSISFDNLSDSDLNKIIDELKTSSNNG